MAKALYVGVSAVARKVKSKYIGVSAVARKVKSGYIGVNGVARQYFSGVNAIPASELAVGDSVWLDVNGTLTEFIVIHQGAVSSLGYTNADGTWLLMKDIYSSQQWHTGTSGTVTYSSAYINKTYLTSTFYNLLDSKTQSAIKTISLPVKKDNMTGSVNYASNVKAFLLSCNEVGFSDTDNFDAGVLLSYFSSGTGTAAKAKRIAYFNGTATAWWLRSIATSTGGSVRQVVNDGTFTTSSRTVYRGVRPALILNSDTPIDESTHTIIE